MVRALRVGVKEREGREDACAVCVCDCGPSTAVCACRKTGEGQRTKRKRKTSRDGCTKTPLSSSCPPLLQARHPCAGGGTRAAHTHTHTHSLSSHPLRTPWHPRGSPSSGERGGGGGREGATRADLPPPLFFSSSSKTSRWTVHLPSSPFFSTTQPHARSPARSRTPRPRLHLGPGRLECGLQEVAVGPAAGWWGWRE